MRKLKIVGWAVFAVIVYLSLVYCLYITEQPVTGSNIRVFADALWYSLVTLTTVGYGDYYPVSTLGKIIGAIFVLSSLGMLGLLIGKIGDQIQQFRESKKLGLYTIDFENHCVIIGWNSFVRSVVNELVLSGQRVAIITDDKEAIDFIHDAYDRDLVFVSLSELGNYDNLRRVGIEESSRVLIGLPEDTESLIMLLNLQKQYGDCGYITTVENRELEHTFRAAGAMHVVPRHSTAAMIAASNIYEPDVAAFASDLIASVDNEEDYEIQQYWMTEGNPYAGKEYGTLFKKLYEDHRCVALGFSQGAGRERELIKLPSDEKIVKAKDHVIVIVNGQNVEAVQDFFGVKQGRHKEQE